MDSKNSQTTPATTSTAPIRQLLGAADAQILPHPPQPQHTNDGAPRTRKQHQQEHRPQRPTERSDPTQHAQGRTGDCPGPRKETTTRRNVTQGAYHRRSSRCFNTSWIMNFLPAQAGMCVPAEASGQTHTPGTCFNFHSGRGGTPPPRSSKWPNPHPLLQHQSPPITLSRAHATRGNPRYTHHGMGGWGRGLGGST